MSDAASVPAGSGFAATAPRRLPRTVVTSGVLGTLLFVGTEVMLFTGFISAYLIVKAGIRQEMWPPPWQPRLPVTSTAFNTAVLLVSGALYFVASQRFTTRGPQSARLPFLLTILTGAFFVVFQGVEWVALLNAGLSFTGTTYGAFFYLLVGTHAAHAVAALIAMAWVGVRMWRSTLTTSQLWSAQVFWTFVVLMWPILYVLVYL